MWYSSLLFASQPLLNFALYLLSQTGERDLESFEGLLKREFGPTVKELKKDLEPLVERSIEEAEKDLIPLAKEAENEIRKDIVPAVENAMGKLRERAGSAADSEVEELKQNAEGLIGKLRGIF